MFEPNENIKLEKAMTKVGGEGIRVWDVPGIHVEKHKDIPKDRTNLTEEKTFVMKAPEGAFQLGVLWTESDGKSQKIVDVEEVSDLQTLKEKYPKIFELEGGSLNFLN